MAQEDTEDARLAAAGDMAAFERLHRRHAGRVQLLARRMLGADAAPEATQDAFVRAWEHLHQFHGDAEFGTWLHRLAVNLFLRMAEQRLRTERRTLELDEDLPSSTREPASAMDVHRALAKLDLSLRQVVVLHDMEGYSHEEIAQLLGITSGGSRMRLHRARTALRAWIAQ
jgi:RNA polymerase sigma-70 factor (ECF subfamily)